MVDEDLPYYIDTNPAADETTRLWATEQGRPVSVKQPGFYKAVIRRRDRPGWVFRFELLGSLAYETLYALNHPTR